MDQQENKREGLSVLRGIASLLNGCGNAVVVSYDAGAKVVGKVFGAAKYLPGVSGKAKGLVTGGLGIIRSDDSKKLYRKIKEYEEKILALYYEIGQTSAKLTEDGIEDKDTVRDSEMVQELLARVNDYKNSINELKTKIVALEEEKKAEAQQAKQQEKYRRATLMARRTKQEKAPVDRRKVVAAVNAAIKDALIHGEFESSSDRAIFDKVATDLMDGDTEIKMLAAAELGKMGNLAAVPVLHTAIGLGDPLLANVIINSLMNLGDPSSKEVFFQYAVVPIERLRVSALRGLYKISPDDVEVRALFREALSDDYPEVRKTAATLLGWVDDKDAVPALVQCLNDENVRVRKAVVSALANTRDRSIMLPLLGQLRDEDRTVREKVLEAVRVVSGEEVAFDLNASGEALTAEMARLKKWWQDERIASEEKSGAGVTADAEITEAPVAATFEESEIEASGASGNSVINEKSSEVEESFVAEADTAEAEINEDVATAESDDSETLEEKAAAEELFIEARDKRSRGNRKK